MPLLDLLWAMLWFFLFVAWLWLLFSIITDLFRSRDLSGWAKGLWTLFIIVLPLLGTIVYLVARGGSMAERTADAVAERDRQARAYIKEAAGANTTSTADELRKLAELRDAGTLTDQEFQAQKARLLAGV